MEVGELPQPHLFDEGGFLQSIIPIGWKGQVYHWARRWLAVILPVSLLFLLLFSLRRERRKRYALREAVLPPGKEFNAICSQTDGALVYLQVKDDVFAQFEALRKYMNEYYSTDGVFTDDDLQAGDYCVVQPTDGADWQRALVVGRLDGVLKVHLVDTGSTQEVDASRSKELTKEFSILPAMAVKCQLEESVDGGGIGSEQLRVEVSDRQADPPIVCIKNELHVPCPTPPKPEPIVSPSPVREEKCDVYHLHEITQGKYFVIGGKLCHVVLEWTVEDGEEEGEGEGEGEGCTAVAVVGNFTGGKEMPLEHVSDRVFRHNIYLPVGQYEFSFMVNGRRTYNRKLPTKTNHSGELINYLSIESLEKRYEVEVKVDAETSPRPVYVIAEDEAVGENMRVVSDEGVSHLHVDFNGEQQVEVNSNNCNSSQVTAAREQPPRLSLTFTWEDIDPDSITLPTPVSSTPMAI